MFVGGIQHLAQKPLVVVSEDTKLIEVCGFLASGTEVVIATDPEGVLRGVVTKTDIVRQISACEGAMCQCATSSAMTRDVVVCRSDDLLQDVSSLMKERHLKSIPVVDQDERPVGVLTARTVLRVLLGEAEQEEAELINYVKGIGYR